MEKQAPEKTEKPQSGSAKPGGNRVRVGAILAAGLAVALVGWLLLSGGDDDSPTEAGAAEAVAVEELQERAAERGVPIYWAGPQEDAELELTETEGGDSIYIRYLTGDAEPGAPQADYLTVGTYAFPDAVAALRKQSREPGGVLASAPGGATVYFDRTRPQSVYLAYPGVEVQIEVYDPDPKRALSLVTSGQIVPVG